MRLPDDTLHISHARMYGAVSGLEFADFEQMEGCPARYKKYIHEGKREVRPAGADPLRYGTVLHEALFLAESTEISLPEALERVWDTSLPPEMYEEAEQDIQRFLEKGGIDLTAVYVEKALEMPLMEFEGRQVYFGGRVDWIGVDPADPETIYYLDYKTNRFPTSRSALARDVQFKGYGTLIEHNLETLFPGMDRPVRMVGILEQLKFETLYQEITVDDMTMFSSWAAAVARAILEDETGKPQLNRWCGSCPDRWDCEEWLGLPGEGELLLDRVSAATTFEERVQLKHRIEEVQNKLRQFVDAVRAEIEESGGGVFDGYEYTIESKEITVTDFLKLQEALEDYNFWDFVKVKETALKDLVKSHPELKLAVDLARDKVIDGTRLSKKKQS